MLLFFALLYHGLRCPALLSSSLPCHVLLLLLSLWLPCHTVPCSAIPFHTLATHPCPALPCLALSSPSYPPLASLSCAGLLCISSLCFEMLLRRRILRLFSLDLRSTWTRWNSDTVSAFSIAATSISQLFYAKKECLKRLISSSIWLQTRIVTQSPNFIASSFISDLEKIDSKDATPPQYLTVRQDELKPLVCANCQNIRYTISIPYKLIVYLCIGSV